MIKRLLTTLALFAALPAWAAWTLHRENDAENDYIDWATLRVVGNLRRVWVLIDLKGPQSDSMHSFLIFEEFDCKEDRGRPLQEDLFTGQMAGGEFVPGERPKPRGWKYIPPGSLIESWLRVVCSRPAPGQ